jgi:hypothetical protein
MAHRVVSLPRSKRDDDAIPGFDTNWSVIEGANFGSLLFVHNDTGVGATALVDGEGNYTFVGKISGLFPTDPFMTWDTIVGTRGGVLFFYNPLSGAAASGSIDRAGTYEFIRSLTGFAPHWNHIASANNGGLLFVNAENGEGATGLLDGAGNYTTVSSISGFSAGWTHVTGTSNGGVFFYDASTGDAATASIDAAGTYTFVGSLPRLATGWTALPPSPARRGDESNRPQAHLAALPGASVTEYPRPGAGRRDLQKEAAAVTIEAGLFEGAFDFLRSEPVDAARHDRPLRSDAQLHGQLGRLLGVSGRYTSMHVNAR